MYGLQVLLGGGSAEGQGYPMVQVHAGDFAGQRFVAVVRVLTVLVTGQLFPQRLDGPCLHACFAL